MSATDRIRRRVAGPSRNGTPSANGVHPPPRWSDRDPFADAVDVAELLATDLPEPEFVAAGVLPRGLVILAARPKVGKSWWVYLAALAIADGRPFLGAVPTRRLPVLYLALEDTRHRLRSRAAKILAGLKWPPPPKRQLTALTTFPRAGNGGLARLAEWFAEHPGGVVVIDTLAKFRDPPKGGGSYSEDYEVCGQLKALADAHGGLVLIVHHTRKSAAADPFDEVSGTLGITGAAVATLVLDRERGGGTGTLYLTGRDLADATLVLTWDAEHGLWTAGDRSDGIHRAEKDTTSGSGSDRCEAWLEKFLAGHAWPDGELSEAAALQGYTERQLRTAKERLRGRTDGPRLFSKKRGFGAGEWWNWMGTRGEPPPDRPGTIPD